MKQIAKTTSVLVVLICGAFLLFAKGNTTEYYKISTLTEVAENEQTFEKVMSVLTHERCLNCHPTDNIPKQGDASKPHLFGMERGIDDHGFAATKCATCHQTENNKYSGVPGAPHWGLAPASMGWQGLSKIEIAEALLDPTKNGGRTHEELIKHMTEDKLVLWAWKPGVDADGKPRSTPPLSEEEFSVAVKQWFSAGAVIPSKK